MKKLMLMCLGLGLAPCMSAQSPKADNAPAYLTPGAEQRINTLKTLSTSIQAKESPKQAVSAIALQQPKKARIAGTALDASTDGLKLVDTMLVTSYDNIYWRGDNDKTERNIFTIGYDKYGYRTTLSERDRQTHYTYETDEKGRWTSRLIEIEEDGTRRPESRQDRTIENDLVTSLTNYREDFGELYKAVYYEIEYHPNQISDSRLENFADACITREVLYDFEGNVISERRFEWVEAYGGYIETYQLGEYVKIEGKILDDHAEQIIYDRYETDSPWIKRSEVHTYYGKLTGAREKIYDEGGNVVNDYANIFEEYQDENGNDVTIRYDVRNGEIAPTIKYVDTPDYGRALDYSVDFNALRTTYGYSVDENDWISPFTTGVKNHVLANGLTEVTQVYGSREQTQTVMAVKIVSSYGDSWSWDLYPATVNEDGSYTITKEVDGGYVYEYYLADGSADKTISQQGGEVRDSYVFMVKAAGSDEWMPLEEFTKTETISGITIRTVYQTDKQGRPSRMTEYITSTRYNNGEEFKSLETIFSYSDNGDYTAETYEVCDQRDISKMALTEKTERETLANGTVRISNYEYDDNGNGTISSANRTESKEYVTIHYSYRKKTGEWEKAWVECENSEYVTEDGTTVTINRRLSDDETYAINDRKQEYKEVDDESGNHIYVLNANYVWDEDNKLWIGEFKSEDLNYCITFLCRDYREINPLYAYDDEYMIVETYPGYVNGETWEHIYNRYEWDYEKNDWKPAGEFTEFSFEYGDNSLTTTKIKKEINDWESKIAKEVTIYQCDDMGRITGKETINEESSENSDGDKWNSRLHTKLQYKYDEATGMPKEEISIDYDEDDQPLSTDIYRYTYTNFTITTGIDSVIEENGESMTIEGRRVSASGRTISVYTLSGAEVARSADSIELPATGAYIVKAGQIVRKVIVR